MYVFIDTNIVTSANFQFYRGGLGELNRYIKENQVTLILTSVLEAEFIRHCSDRFKALNDAYNVLCKDLEEYDIKSPWKSFQNDLNEKIYIPLEDFLANSQNIKLELSKDCIESIVEDYREGKPPFGKSKKDEFKDAINIHLLKEFKKSIPEPIHIVSTDELFREAFCKSNHDFITHKNINQFLPVLRQLKTGDKNIGELLTKYFDRVEFKDEAILYLGNRNIYKAVNYNICIQWVESVAQLDFSFALTSLVGKNCEGVLYIQGLAYVLFSNTGAEAVFFDDSGNPIDVMFRGTVLINTSIPFKVQCKEEINMQPPSIDKFEIDWSQLKVDVPKHRMKDGALDFISTLK